jgi:hypothetical protein
MNNATKALEESGVYALTLSSSALVALFIQHISELSLKRYSMIAIPKALEESVKAYTQRLCGIEKPLKALSKY